MTRFDRVAVVGAGTMGNGIAQTFASYDTNVLLVDVDEAALKRGMAAIQKSVDRFLKKGKLDEKKAREIVGRVEATTDLKQVGDVPLVVEAVVERIDVKRTVFQTLDEVTPDADNWKYAPPMM